MLQHRHDNGGQSLASSFHDLGLQRLATSSHLIDVGLGDERCGALPFLDIGFKLFHCFFEIVESFLEQRRLCCVRSFHPERFFFEGALSALSSSREPRGVEEREFVDFVFVLIGIACAIRTDGIFGFVKPLLICRGLGCGLPTVSSPRLSYCRHSVCGKFWFLTRARRAIRNEAHQLRHHVSD